MLLEIPVIIFGTQQGELNQADWVSSLQDIQPHETSLLTVLTLARQSPFFVVGSSQLLLFSQLAMLCMFLWMESFLVDYFWFFRTYNSLSCFVLIANSRCHICFAVQALLLGRGKRGDLHIEKKSTFVLDQIKLVSLALLLDCQLVLNSPCSWSAFKFRNCRFLTYLWFFSIGECWRAFRNMEYWSPGSGCIAWTWQGKIGFVVGKMDV